MTGLKQPPASVDNDTINDTNNELELLEHHFHNEEFWIPDDISQYFQLQTNGVNIFGAWVEIYDSVPTKMDLHRFIIVNTPNDGVYELELGVGAVGQEQAITRTDFVLDSVAQGMPRSPIDILCDRDDIPQGSRVVARLKCSLAAVQTGRFRFGYHLYG